MAGKKRYRIEFDRENCIGAGACAAVCPDFWIMKEDGKASLKGAKKSGSKETLEISEENLKENFKAACACNKQAAESCPVNVIAIIDLATGKRII